MDLESECYGLQSVRDIELVALESFEIVGESETKLKNNAKFHVDDNIKVEFTRETSPSETVVSPSVVTKGRGLRKWRRISRNEANSNLESKKKWGLSVFDGEMRQQSGGSFTSLHAMLNVFGNGSDCSVVYSDCGLGGPAVFAAREDSENGEDHGSRGSTAASVPWVRHEIPQLVGFGLDKNRMSGKSSGISVQAGDQHGNSRVVNSKKARGLKIEKENSRSSLESDCRSSNFVFVQGTNVVKSNGRQSGRSASYDEEYSDDAQYGDKLVSKEAQADSCWEVKERNRESHEGDRDTLVESTIILHSVQEELEKEVQKLRAVGKDDPSFTEDYGQPPESTSYTFETETIDLKQNVAHLQSKLKKTREMLVLKQAKVCGLESSFNLGDIKTELDELFKQRIEAEVKYLVISKTIQNLRTVPKDQIKLNVQQKNVAVTHAQASGTTDNDTVETEVLKLRNKVCRFTSCFAIQLILLLVVFYPCILLFCSQTAEVVPT